MQKSDFVKLSDNLWEIPKTFRADMRVQARVYVSEKLLEQIEDDSIKQLVNATTFPGIEKYAMAMPDVHTGYGVPIGFVGAMDAKTGVISPGAIGYDINCLLGKSKILMSYGYTVEIEKLEKKWRDAQTLTFARNKSLEPSKIGAFIRRSFGNEVYKLRTRGDDEIIATPDHPVFTPNGMVPLKDLKLKERIAIFPFQGVSYTQPSRKRIIDEQNVRNVLEQLGRTSESVSFRIILKKLLEKNLLPITYDHPKLPLLLKIIGFVFGDGSINFIGKKQDGISYFVGQKHDLERIRNDIHELGYTPSPIHSRERTTKNGVAYIEHSFYVNASSLVVLFHALGVPMGDKVSQPYRVPKWIFRAALWQKRLFLATLFGAELRIPHRRLGRRGNFNCPVFPMAKQEPYIENGKEFLRDLAKMLKEFGVDAYKIVQRKMHIDVEGKTSWALELVFPANLENLIHLWSRVGFEYNHERAFFANGATQYLKIKRSELAEKKEAIRITIPELLARGLSYQAIGGQLAGNPLTPRFIIDVCTKLKKGRKNIIPRIPISFMPFDEYIARATQGLGKSGVIWDDIVSIKKVSYTGFVYDLTLLHKDHNFIADNCVVSNCGMRLLASQLTAQELQPKLDAVATEIQREVPSGLGRGRQLKFDISEMNRILEGGSKYLLEKGYGEGEDVENCEEEGQMRGADASLVSDHAKRRGSDQAGTLGSGNHFLEIQRVEQIFDEEAAKTFSLFPNQVVVMIHTGSRGLGHQNATDYIRLMIAAMRKYNIHLPDQELACAPFNSEEGQRYLGALACGLNFGWANRQMIGHFVRKAWNTILGDAGGKLYMVYDVAHNTAKMEEYEVEGEKKKLLVHRKGSTRAFPAGSPDIPEKYRQVGQPVFIPGSMGTASYVLVGVSTGEETFFTTCHGAGRLMSRHAAIRNLSAQEIVKNLEKKGILVKCWSLRGIAEEAPQAYKDIEEVINVVHNAGISKKVARLVPLAVIKGE